METTALEYSPNFQPVEVINDFIESGIKPVKNLLATFNKYINKNTKIFELRSKIDKCLKLENKLLETIFQNGILTSMNQSDAIVQQTQILLEASLRHSLYCYERILYITKKEPKLTSKQFRNLKKLMSDILTTHKIVEEKVLQNTSFPINNAELRYKIGQYNFIVPLHVNIEDDEDGKLASCLEIPQVYGCGENEQEALQMLDNSIISLYEDLCEDIPVSKEYQIVKKFFDIAIKNEK